MLDGLAVLDADAHVVEPGGLFEATGVEGTAVGGMAAADLPPDTPMVPVGDASLIADQIEHGFDPPSYLRAMDAQGIDGAVVYPSIGLFVPYLPELSAEGSASACRAYNEWVAGWCGEAPDRLAAVGLVPTADVAMAVAETARAAELGLVGVMVRPNHLYGRNLGDRALDPLYDALEERGMPLSVHEGLGVRGPTLGTDRFDDFARRHACSHPMEQMASMASLVLDGALERHPGLAVAFLESGTGWLPFWLSRLDDHVEWLDDDRRGALSLTPGEYFRRQCVISTEADDAQLSWVLDTVGADRVVWASDFPHPDAVYPGSARELRGRLDDDALAAAVLWDTPLELYGLSGRFPSPPTL